MRAFSFFIILMMMFGGRVSAADSATVYKETVQNAYSITKSMCAGYGLTDAEVYEIIKNSPDGYRLNSPKESDAMFLMGYANKIRSGKYWSEQANIAWQSFKHSTKVMFTSDEEYLKLAATEMSASITPELLGLLDSEGYFQALRECYGDNQIKKDLFTAELIAAHSLGTIVSFYLPIKLVNWGLNSLKATYVGVRYARQLRYAGWGLNIAVLTPPVLYIANQVYLMYLMDKMQKQLQEVINNPCTMEIPSSFSPEEFLAAEKKVLQDIERLKKEVLSYAAENIETADYNKLKSDLERKENLILKLQQSKQQVQEACQQPIQG